MEVRLLGPVSVEDGDGPVALPSGKPLAVLAMLALAAPDAVSASRLVRGLWGPDAPDNAPKTLQVHISGLRKRLRAHGVELSYSPAGYRLDVTPQSVDVVQFTELVGDGVRELQSGHPHVAGPLLRAALDLWSGEEPLANVEAPFATAEAERLRLRRREAVRARVDADLAVGLGAALVQELRRVVESEPYDEHASGQLARALYQAGQPAAALSELSSARSRLRDDLGLDPGPELVALERQLLNHDEALAPPTQVAQPRHNLPDYVSTFVGRSQERSDLVAALDKSRLVTVTGAGGAGKTRLAVATAGLLLSQFPDGVWLADLSPVSSVGAIISTLANAIGIRSEVDTDALAEALRTRRVLLVLDNCEHVIDDIAELTALLLRRCPTLHVLTTSREPLAIDGERVYRIPGLHVPDEDLESVEALGNCDAVRLFADRAALHHQDFTLDGTSAVVVARICRRVDGLPLGIELAAARLAVLPLVEIDQRLHQRLALLSGGGRRVLARQQTLRALIGWSYDLLDPDSQLMLATLSVFVGGFDLKAVEDVAARAGLADLAGSAPLDLVSDLVSKSLVESVPADRPRFRLLETVREYAAEQLATRPEAVETCRRAHADHYAQIALTAGHDLERGRDQPQWLDRLADDYDNLRAAWTYLLHSTSIATGLNLCIGLRRFWIARGLVGDGSRATTSFIERAASDEDPHTVGMALGTAASLAWNLGDVDETAALAGRATEGPRGDDLDVLVLAGRVESLVMVARGEPTRAVESLTKLLALGVSDHARQQTESALAYALIASERLPEARTVLQVHVDALRVDGDVDLLANALINLSSVEIAETNLESAREAVTEGLAIANLTHDDLTSAWLTNNLALLELTLGDVVAARAAYSIVLELVRAHEEPVIKLSGINGLVLCTDPQSTFAATLARLHGAIHALSEAHGLQFDRTERELITAHRLHLLSHLGEEEYARLNRQGSALTLSEAAIITSSLVAGV